MTSLKKKREFDDSQGSGEKGKGEGGGKTLLLPQEPHSRIERRLAVKGKNSISRLLKWEGPDRKWSTFGSPPRSGTSGIKNDCLFLFLSVRRKWADGAIRIFRGLREGEEKEKLSVGSSVEVGNFPPLCG